MLDGAENIAVHSEPDKLVVTIDTRVDLGPSKSGKSTLVATARKPLEVADFEGNEILLTLTAYKRA